MSEVGSRDNYLERNLKTRTGIASMGNAIIKEATRDKTGDKIPMFSGDTRRRLMNNALIGEKIEGREG